MFVYILFVVMAVGAGLVWSGAYNVAADVEHWGWVRRLFETTRERSIAARAKDIQAPPLEDPKQIAEGAQQYSEMCVSCHLAPGVDDSEIRQGLYPEPPVPPKSHRRCRATILDHQTRHQVDRHACRGATRRCHDPGQSSHSCTRCLHCTPAQYRALAGTETRAHDHDDREHGDGSSTNHHHERPK